MVTTAKVAHQIFAKYSISYLFNSQPILMIKSLKFTSNVMLQFILTEDLCAINTLSAVGTGPKACSILEKRTV